MTELFSLDGRLSVCASLVRTGAAVADVGTDHAYLPIWLAANGLIRSAVASDVREKPLRSGEENIKKYGCEGIVKTRLCSGLDAINADEADDIVIAGMGGELMADILSRAAWVKDPEKRLILQPMTKAHSLREYLCTEGFEIISETPCAHSGKLYTVIYAMFTGNARQPSAYFTYAGKLDSDSSLSREYMKNITRKLRNKRNGLKCSGGDTAELDAVIDEIVKEFGVDENDNG